MSIKAILKQLPDMVRDLPAIQMLVELIDSQALIIHQLREQVQKQDEIIRQQVEAIQRQAEQIQSQQKTIDELKDEISRLNKTPKRPKSIMNVECVGKAHML